MEIYLGLKEGELFVYLRGSGPVTTHINFTPAEYNGADNLSEYAGIRDGNVYFASNSKKVSEPRMLLSLGRHFSDTPGISRNYSGLAKIICKALEMGDYRIIRDVSVETILELTRSSA